MGVPVIAPPRGVFLETITPGMDGYFAASLAEWVQAIKLALAQRSRSPAATIRREALFRHSPYVIASRYASFFRHAETLMGDGWYANLSTGAPA